MRKRLLGVGSALAVILYAVGSTSASAETGSPNSVCAEPLLGPANVEIISAGQAFRPEMRMQQTGPAGYSISGWIKPDSATGGIISVVETSKGRLVLEARSGSFVAKTGKVVVTVPDSLSFGRWNFFVISFDGQQLSASVDGKPSVPQSVNLDGAIRSIVVAPIIEDENRFTGRIADLTACAGQVADLTKKPSSEPNDDLVAFKSNSATWPVQTKQMVGQTEPQPAWTLPRSSATAEKHTSRPAYAGPALVANTEGQLELRAWTLLYDDSNADGAAMSTNAAASKGNWLAATVPGTVLTSLVDRGIYPDPAVGLNNLQIPETLHDRPYWYRSEFLTPPDLTAKSHIWLTFEGINYAAEVWINGNRLGDVKGAFIRGTFDIAPYLKSGAANVVAVKILPPPNPGIAQEESLSAGPGENGGMMGLDGPTFASSEGWDWMPSVRDRNMGIWQPVTLTSTGDLKLDHPFVVADFPEVGTRRADLTIRVPVSNLTSKPMAARLVARVQSPTGVGNAIEVEQRVTLAPGQTEVIFDPAHFDRLKLTNPHLWWPNGYGRPDLYALDVRAFHEDTQSDQTTTRFGVRKVTYELSLVDHAGKLRRVDADPTAAFQLGTSILDVRHEAIRQVGEGAWALSLKNSADRTPAIADLSDTKLTPHLVIKVNGVRIAARGGNWGMDDFMKRVGRERMEPYFKLHQRANLNVIRNWMGQSTEEVFYDLADQYGLMVLNDFWMSTQNYNQEPADASLFLRNAADVIARFRGHPSIVLWLGRNEGVPPPLINEGLAKLIAEQDGTRLYMPSSRLINMQNSGPWDYRDPAEYFGDLATGFSTEVGTPSFPTLEAFKKMVPEPDRWPVSDTWAYHDWHSQGGGKTKGFTDAMDASLGTPHSLEEFERRAQLMNFESHRAIFEGMNSGLWTKNSGRLLWMTQPAWPSTEWQIFSHDYDTQAAFYGTQIAAEPVHVQMDLPDHKIRIINNPTKPLNFAKVYLRLYDKTGVLLMTKQRPVSVAADDISPPIDFGIGSWVSKQGLIFVHLELRDQNGHLLSRNVYWPGANRQATSVLNALAPVDLKVSLKSNSDSVNRHFVAHLDNPTDTPAIGTKLTVVDALGRTVLPVYFDKNYVSLMPHENIDVTFEVPSDEPMRVEIRGWNLRAQTVATTTDGAAK